MKIFILIFSIFLICPNCFAIDELPSAQTYGGGSWSPILVGALIGLLSCATRYFSKKAVGASSAYATASGLLGKYFAKEHTLKLKYFRDKPPTWNWELFFVLFAVLGGFLAAFHGNETDLRFSPQMWEDKFGAWGSLRFITSLIGGVLLAVGSRIAGGCTSGHGISGTQEMSIGSWVSLLCFFIGGAIVSSLLLG